MIRRLLALVSSCAAMMASAAAPAHYTMDDFDRVPKIDVHVHLHGDLPEFLARARADNVRLLTINVDYADFPAIAEQQRTAIALVHDNPDLIAFAATFPVTGFDQPGFADASLRRLDDAFAHGAIAVKVWKNIGMELRDASGHAVMVDDPRLAPIFDSLERRGIVLMGHQAEPLNCWLAPGKMTVKGDRTYFSEHPQYYMAAHPEWPSHEAQIAARDHLLELHPKLNFVGLHLASLEWDVDRIATFLDRFPQATVDVAARLVHLQQQAMHHRDKVRRFLIKYQDRILYGTDIARMPEATDAAFAVEADETWRADWRFLNTDDVMRSDDLPAPFRGLALPKSVVDKIYRTNALRVFPGAWHAPATIALEPPRESRP